jgi:uncharacterized RDD family membrane protein YckC
MTSYRSIRIGVAATTATLVATLLVGGVAAQTTTPDPSSSAQASRETTPPPSSTQAPETSPTDGQQDFEQPFRRYRGRPVVRIGQDHLVRASEVVRDVVVISGSATVEGRLEGDLVVVLGSATLAPTAVVEGDVVVVSGDANVASGAVVGRDLVVVGGALNAPADFAPGGDQVVVGARLLGYDFRGIVPWVTKGLLWGRPLVPELPWMWAIVGVFLFIYLCVSLLLPGPVRATAATLTQRPLSAFLTGLLVLLLIGPVSVILSVSVIGLPVVPLLFCALLVAGVLGKVAVMHWTGDRIIAPDPDNRVQTTRSFLIGFAVITIAYMVPVFGFTAWALLGVLSLGAASLAFLSALRRENPEAPRRPFATVALAGGAAAYTPPTPPGPPMPPPAPAPPVSRFDDAPPAASQADMPSAPASAPWQAPPPSGPPPVATDLRGFPHAPFLDRAAAFALDVILVLIAFHLLGIRGPGDDRTYFLLLLAYHVGAWVWKGTTVGGIICNLRVIRTDGAPLQFVDALVRGLSSILSLAVAGLGALWILKDPERQAWHDKIAGTYVVKVPRHWPL